VNGKPGYGSCFGFVIDESVDLDFFKDAVVFVSEVSIFEALFGLSRLLGLVLVSRMLAFLVGSLRVSVLSSLSQFILALRSAAACLSFSCLARDLYKENVGGPGGKRSSYTMHILRTSTNDSGIAVCIGTSSVVSWLMDKTH
jgi:hypothetical protein